MSQRILTCGQSSRGCELRERDPRSRGEACEPKKAETIKVCVRRRPEKLVERILERCHCSESSLEADCAGTAGMGMQSRHQRIWRHVMTKLRHPELGDSRVAKALVAHDVGQA
jgi:hypothetical protein